LYSVAIDKNIVDIFQSNIKNPGRYFVYAPRSECSINAASPWHRGASRNESLPVMIWINRAFFSVDMVRALPDKS